MPPPPTYGTPAVKSSRGPTSSRRKCSTAAAAVREHDVVSVQLSPYGIEETLRLFGLVVYAEPGLGFGLRFAEFTPRTRVRLKQLLTLLAT